MNQCNKSQLERDVEEVLASLSLRYNYTNVHGGRAGANIDSSGANVDSAGASGGASHSNAAIPFYVDVVGVELPSTITPNNNHNNKNNHNNNNNNGPQNHPNSSREVGTGVDSWTSIPIPDDADDDIYPTSDPKAPCLPSAPNEDVVDAHTTPKKKIPPRASNTTPDQISTTPERPWTAPRFTSSAPKSTIKASSSEPSKDPPSRLTLLKTLYKRNRKYLSLIILCFLIYIAVKMSTRDQVDELLSGGGASGHHRLQPCPNDLFVFNANLKACYLFVHSPVGSNVLDWETAEKYCDENQASLAHVREEAEQQWLNRFG